MIELLRQIRLNNAKQPPLVGQPPVAAAFNKRTEEWSIPVCLAFEAQTLRRRDKYCCCIITVYPTPVIHILQSFDSYNKHSYLNILSATVGKSFVAR